MSAVPARVFRPTPGGGAALPATPARRPLRRRAASSRRTLLRLREQRIRDLGNRAQISAETNSEMTRYEQAADLIGLEDRLPSRSRAVAATSVHRSPPSARCACAPWGQHFCELRLPAGDALVASSCGHALPADAKFCASCGTVAAHDAHHRRGAATAPGAARTSNPDRSTASNAACASRAPGSRPPSGRPGSTGCAGVSRAGSYRSSQRCSSRR
jgi:hypothetical protein